LPSARLDSSNYPTFSKNLNYCIVLQYIVKQYTGGILISTLFALALFTSEPSAEDTGAIVTGQNVSIELVSSDGSSFEDTYQIELGSATETVSVVWGNLGRATWGSSFATSSEWLDLYYTGEAKAAGNVYQNLRIVKVCIWYTRDGALISSKVCSNATFSGGIWRAGSKVSTTTWDVLVWDGPKTIFNISTVRIPPNTIP
jgi:hypothetical protein